MQDIRAWGIEQHKRFLEKFRDVSLGDLPENSLLEAVIVEPRMSEMEMLELVCKNVAYYLPHASMTVCCSRENVEAVEAFTRGTKIRVIVVSQGNITRDEYSHLLSYGNFWSNFTDGDPRKRVLIFQTDTGLRKNSILQFMEFDYIGAGWPWNRGVGNGGLSLRCPRACQTVCEFYAHRRGDAEDLFFSNGMIAHRKNIAPYNTACAFAVEYDQDGCPDPMGFHQGFHWWTPWYTQQMFTPVPVLGGPRTHLVRAMFDGKDITDLVQLGEDASGALCIPEGTMLDVTHTRNGTLTLTFSDGKTRALPVLHGCVQRGL